MRLSSVLPTPVAPVRTITLGMESLDEVFSTLSRGALASTLLLIAPLAPTLHCTAARDGTSATPARQERIVALQVQ